MKKLLASLALICVAGYAFGQGQVNFVNNASTLVSTNGASVGLTTGTLSSAIPSYYFGLFWAPAGTTDASAFTYVSRGTNQAATGRFSGGAGTGAPQIAGQAVGTTVNVLFRGWDAAAGPAWSTDLAQTATWYGQSGIATVILGGGATPIPNPFGTGAGQIGGFALLPVPEPSSFALAGLGAAALLIFRRRK